jgi:hypothetical protein
MLQSHVPESTVETVRSVWYVEDDPSAFAPLTVARVATRALSVAPTDAPTEMCVASESEPVAGKALH